MSEKVGKMKLCGEKKKNLCLFLVWLEIILKCVDILKIGFQLEMQNDP